MARYTVTFRDNGKPQERQVNTPKRQTMTQVSPWTGMPTGTIYPTYTHNPSGVWYDTEAGKIHFQVDRTDYWIATDLSGFDEFCSELEKGQTPLEVYNNL